MKTAAHDWLDLRSPFDDAARRHSLPLIDQVAAALSTGREASPEPLTIIDIGAGTGRSALWFDRHLRPRLTGRSLHWVLLDADSASLRGAERVMPAAVTVAAPISRLPEVVAAQQPAGAAPGRLLITCSAVLDVLTPADVEVILDTLIRCAGLGLFLLSITDEYRLDPPDPRDAALSQAFAAHQARGGRLGSAGGVTLAGAARRAGAAVTTTTSPWQLAGPRDRAFIARFLTERIEAAAEADPALGAAGRAWLHDRLSQAKTRLSVRVDHLDVLVDARHLA